jgi:putative component of toxin-antitoxin plasmid stabilization module
VEAGNTTKGEEWNYTLRVHDGETYSIYYNSTTVSILNSLPITTALSIENAGSLRTTDDLVANWTFSDLDLDNQDNYIISWYKNGELQGDLNDTITVGAGNTTRGEFWKFTLQVHDGEDWSNTYTSQATSILNTAPEASNVDLTSNPFTIDDLEATWEYNDNDSDSQSSWLIRWYKDGVLQPSLNNSNTVSSSLTFKGENWNYTLQVFDGSDYSIIYNSPVITILNSIPTVSVLTITPTPYNITNLMISWMFGDDDVGDNQDSYEIRWYRNGELQSHLNDKTAVEAGNTTKGEEWNYTLRVHDGEAYSIYYNSTTVTILNSLPIATALSIENAGSLRTTDDLVANWTFSDLDLDNQDNFIISWYKDDEFQGDLNDTFTVGSGNTTRGELWKFTLQVHDGEDWSIIYTSQHIYILNTSPEASNVDLTSNPITTDELVATWDYTDIDNDSQSSWRIHWYKDGVLQPSQNDSNTVSSSLTVKGEDWNYTLQVYDGSNYSIVYNSPIITILNSIPTASGLVITLTPYNITNLMMNWMFGDDDVGDNQDSYEIRWYRNGELQSHLNDKSAVEAGNTTKGEEWNYTVRVHDGEAYSIYYNSTTVTILNSLPIATALSIENAGSLRTTDDLVANWTFNDLDLDNQDNYRISWYWNGDLQGNLNDTKIVQAGNTSKDEWWKFTLQVHDGEDWSIIYSSQQTKIFNSVPEISGIVNITFINDLTVYYNYTDADNDQEIGTKIRWFKNNILEPVHNDLKTISGSVLFKGDYWNVTVMVYDGSEFGELASSNAYLISNTAPEVVSTEIIDSANLYNSSYLVVSYDSIDVDEDPIVDFQIIWYVFNGSDFITVPELENFTVVDPFYTRKGQIWKFEVRVFDGTDWSSARTLALGATIRNTKPEIDNIVLQGGLTTDDNVSVSYDFIDNDNDTESGSTIIWQIIRDGSLLTPSQGNNLSNSWTRAGDTIYCMIIPEDGEEQGDIIVTTQISPPGIIIVGNTPPVLTSAPKIVGNNGTTDYSSTDYLYVNYTAYDPDSEDEEGTIYDIKLVEENGFLLVFEAEYQWYKNGELTHIVTSSVNPQFLFKDDIWMVRVKIRDVYGSFSDWYNSSTIIIGNSKPELRVIAWSSDTLTTNEDLVISYDYFDKDDDPEGTTLICWFINDTEIFDNENQTILSNALFNKGDNITTIITPHDGEDYGDTNSTFITVTNTNPKASDRIIVNAENLRTNDNLIVNWTFYDVDGDDQVSYKIRWYRNGELQKNLNDSLIVGTNNTSKGQSWYFTLQVYDGEDYSAEYQSGSVLIRNSQMMITSATINDNASTAYADQVLIVNYTKIDLDNDIDLYKNITWHVNGVYIAIHDNKTSIDPIYLVKGDEWSYVISIADVNRLWSNVYNSSIILIINSKPRVSGIVFVFDNVGINPINNSREFLIEDEQLNITYTFSDVDADPDDSIIYWYRDGELQNSYTNMTVLPTNVTSPGETWRVVLIPHDGVEAGSQVISINITIEGRPVIHDHVIEPLFHNEGTYDFWAETNVVNNSITRVEYLITVIALDLTTDVQYAAPNGTTDFWVLEDFSILELLEDPADFKDLIGTNVTINVTVITTVTYSSVDYLIKTYFSYTFIIEDNAPPRVTIAGFSYDQANPTDITFYAILQDYGRGVDEVVLYYDFVLVVNATNGNGADHSWRSKYLQVPSFPNSILMTYNGTYYITIVPFKPNGPTDIYYRIQAADESGNINVDAYPAGHNSLRVSELRYRPTITGFSSEQIIPIILGVLIVSAIIIFVGIRKFRTTELVGLDIDVLMESINQISEEEIIRSQDKYTLGIVVSFFDQLDGPTPIFVEPIILKDNFNKLLELSDLSFSATRFAKNFDEELPSTFDFYIDSEHRSTSVSYGYALERPNARGGAENITLNVLVYRAYSELIIQFREQFDYLVHEIHVSMDKNPSDRKTIGDLVFKLRKLIASILLAYENLYGPIGEELEEELEEEGD